ncbi:hypothetical protein [Vibrio hangzhouensis]|uniref:Uncharacterized protein n=1 Tax=Vibrio hangzhouensis TaxID=462991 RepID=A0A1H6CBN3_9VIBR|nr:hypothetical protein [Vibrio hangzhouensis]SEG70409.1 hypothetical protein SAMN04488244_1356 [Vibrio hangzhouensis]
MRNIAFMAVCLAITIWMIFDSGKSEQVFTFWNHINLPEKEQIGMYVSQFFYYIALLVGVVYLGRKFKRRK